MNINNIDLRHLKYFLAVAEELSFTKAAERLNMSQPPLSAQIKHLEEELSTELFIRTKRSVQLTEAGLYLVTATRDLLDKMQSAMHGAQSVGHGGHGQIIIGSNLFPLFHPAFSRIIQSYHTNHPDIRLVFKEMLIEQAQEEVRNGTVDIAFCWPETIPTTGPLSYEIIAEEHIKLCISIDHPLAAKDEITVRDLQNEIFLLAKRQGRSALLEEIQRRALAHGFHLKLHQETPIFQIIINLVAANYGVAFLPEFLQSIVPGRVKFVGLRQLDPKLTRLPIALCYNKKQHNIKTQNFLKCALAD